MACCSARTFVLMICILQLIATAIREVFDFLGYMWAPIIANFLQLICVILGTFGVYHFKPKYLGVYCLWSLIWFGWNIFLICFYLEVGVLRRDLDILSIGTGSQSWWATHGFGCRVISNNTEYDQQNSGMTTDCLVEYPYVECIQAGLQCFLTFLGFIGAAFIIYVYSEEDDSFDFIGGFDSYTSYHSPSKTSHIHLQPIYEEKHQRTTV